MSFPGGSDSNNLTAMQEIQESLILQEDPGRSPAEGNDTHSSILDWKIHGRRNLAGYRLQVQRVKHDLETIPPPTTTSNMLELVQAIREWVWGMRIKGNNKSTIRRGKSLWSGVHIFSEAAEVQLLLGDRSSVALVQEI